MFGKTSEDPLLLEDFSQMFAIQIWRCHANFIDVDYFWMQLFFAYSWKLLTYSGAFLLTIDNFSFSTYNFCFFLLTVGAFLLTVEECV